MRTVSSPPPMETSSPPRLPVEEMLQVHLTCEPPLGVVFREGGWADELLFSTGSCDTMTEEKQLLLDGTMDEQRHR